MFVNVAKKAKKIKLNLKEVMYDSSSGESKYSNEDREMKDHLLTGEEALLNSLKKNKNASKIVQINKVNGNDEKTSHLVHYYNAMNEQAQIPKSFGMVHRKSKVDQINFSETKLSNPHAEVIAKNI